jgi:hypothetical protein
MVYNELLEIKEEQKRKQDKKKKKKVEIEDYEEKEESDSDDEIQYSCIIIDDFANDLKNNDIQTQLNKMIIITTLQLYKVFFIILKFCESKLHIELYLKQKILKNGLKFQKNYLTIIKMTH